MPAPKDCSSLTLSRLKEVLDYDPETGVFTWKVLLSKNVPVGSRAGRVWGRRYRFIGIDRKSYLASRLAWLYVYGCWPSRILRYKDRNPDNCAIDNLIESVSKFATRSEYEKYLRAANFMKFRAADITRNFGISIETYQKLFASQGGVCAVCKQPETEKRNGQVKWLAIDHCHDTNMVRGLLCVACNVSIGRMGDNPERLDAAAAYIRKSREVPNEETNVIRLIPRKAS
jgi:Recombination endonuclease VII/HNH endonuclease